MCLSDFALMETACALSFRTQNVNVLVNLEVRLEENAQ